jgi:hypothetical protein
MQQRQHTTGYRAPGSAEMCSVLMDEEIEHYRFAVRDLAVLEARSDAAASE